MDISLVWMLALAVVGVVGSLQWLKGFFGEGVVPTWVWRVLMALLCVGWALAIGQTWLYRFLIGGFLVAVCEGGYKLAIQKLPELAGKLMDKLG